MHHFVTSYMKQNSSHKQTLESAQNGLEISFKMMKFYHVCFSLVIDLFYVVVLCIFSMVTNYTTISTVKYLSLF